MIEQEVRTKVKTKLLQRQLWSEEEGKQIDDLDEQEMVDVEPLEIDKRNHQTEAWGRVKLAGHWHQKRLTRMKESWANCLACSAQSSANSGKCQKETFHAVGL